MAKAPANCFEAFSFALIRLASITLVENACVAALPIECMCRSASTVSEPMLPVEMRVRVVTMLIEIPTELAIPWRIKIFESFKGLMLFSYAVKGTFLVKHPVLLLPDIRTFTREVESLELQP